MNRQYKTNYQPIGNKWYLQSIWQQASGDERNIQYRYITEFATTKIERDTTLPLDYADRLQYSEVLSLKPSPYNAGFWKDYNIVAETQQLKDLLIDTTHAVTPVALSEKKINDLVNQFIPANQAKAKARQQSLQKVLVTFNRLRPVFIIPGVTLLQNSASSISLNYTNPQGNTVINQTVPVKANAAVVGIGFGFEYDIVKNLKVHYMSYSGYGNYNNTALDLGLGYRKQITPANKRPVYLMLAANYSVNTINQQLTEYQYNGAPATVGDKTFNYDIRSTLFSRQKGFKPQLGFSIELNKLLSVYAQTGYNFYISQTDGIKFISHSGNFFKDLFPRRQELSTTATGINLLIDNKPNQQLPYRANWFFNIGIKGFLRFR